MPVLADNPAHLLVVAYPAAAHHEISVERALQSLRQRQAARPGIRLAAAACGRSDERVTRTDVEALLSPDNQTHGRYALRAIEPEQLSEEAVGWVSATAHAIGNRTVTAPPLPAYSPNSLIQQAEEPTTWLGGI